MDSLTTLLLCIVIPVAVIGSLLWVQGNVRRDLQKRIDAAYAAYQEALAALRADPANPEKRQAAVDLGRAYSAITRENKAVTTYDEMALMNDVQAAAAASAVSRPDSAPAPAQLDVSERLRRLEDLKAQGLISDEEYAARRAKILEDV